MIFYALLTNHRAFFDLGVQMGLQEKSLLLKVNKSEHYKRKCGSRHCANCTAMLVTLLVTTKYR